jgi:hypothetical protein
MCTVTKTTEFKLYTERLLTGKLRGRYRRSGIDTEVRSRCGESQGRYRRSGEHAGRSRVVGKDSTNLFLLWKYSSTSLVEIF